MGHVGREGFVDDGPVELGVEPALLVRIKARQYLVDEGVDPVRLGVAPVQAARREELAAVLPERLAWIMRGEAEVEDVATVALRCVGP